MNCLNHLPTELILSVTEHLMLDDLYNLQGTCKGIYFKLLPQLNQVNALVNFIRHLQNGDDQVAHLALAMLPLVKSLRPDILVSLVPLIQVDFDQFSNHGMLSLARPAVTSLSFRKRHFLTYLTYTQVGTELAWFWLEKLAPRCYARPARTNPPCNLPMSNCAQDMFNMAVLTNQVELVERFLENPHFKMVKYSINLFQRLYWALRFQFFALARLLWPQIQFKDLLSSYRQAYQDFATLIKAEDPVQIWRLEMFTLRPSQLGLPPGTVLSPTNTPTDYMTVKEIVSGADMPIELQQIRAFLDTGRIM
ncbi:hypothetical protein H4R33_003501 [Dimargaris cristalligena]|nr:hypothetical protein H4R33_003501 [Dimargaris cristalligena]